MGGVGWGGHVVAAANSQNRNTQQQMVWKQTKGTARKNGRDRRPRPWESTSVTKGGRGLKVAWSCMSWRVCYDRAVAVAAAALSPSHGTLHVPPNWPAPPGSGAAAGSPPPLLGCLGVTPQCRWQRASAERARKLLGCRRPLRQVTRRAGPPLLSAPLAASAPPAAAAAATAPDDEARR